MTNAAQHAPDCFTMANTVMEKDMTLLEMVEDDDLLDLSSTAESDARKNVADLVDQEHIKAQLQADDGNMGNHLMLFKVSWLKHSNAPSIPKFYKTETNRTMIRKVILDGQAASMA